MKSNESSLDLLASNESSNFKTPKIPNKKEGNRGAFSISYMGVSKNSGTPKSMVYNEKLY